MVMAYGQAITQGPGGQMYTDTSMQTPYNPPQNQPYQQEPAPFIRNIVNGSDLMSRSRQEIQPIQDMRARPPVQDMMFRGQATGFDGNPIRNFGPQRGIGSFQNPFGGFMGGGRGNFMQPQPPMYGGGFGGGYNRPMPQPMPIARPRPQPMPRPVRPSLDSLRPVRPQPIQRIGNYGLDRRINDVARPAPMMQTQGPENLGFGQMEFLTNKK